MQIMSPEMYVKVFSLLKRLKDFRQAELEARPEVYEGSYDSLQDYDNMISLLDECEVAEQLIKEIKEGK